MKLNQWKMVVAGLAVVSVCAAGSTAFFFFKYRSLRLSSLSVSTENDAEKLVAEVGRLVVLPNEKPTIATVTDPEKLKNQAFFSNAKAGDKILIFSQSKKAILYDPRQKRVVEMAPVNVGSPGEKSGVGSNASTTDAQAGSVSGSVPR